MSDNIVIEDKKNRKLLYLSDFVLSNIPLVIFVAVLIFAAVRYDNFFGKFNITSMLASTDFICIGLMAIGMTFVISAAEIDLSVAGIVVSASVIAAQFSTNNIVIVLLVSILFGVVIGLINGGLVTIANLPSFIVTLAMLLALRGLALLLSGRQKIPVEYSSSLVKFYNYKVFHILPAPFIVVMLIFIIAWIIFSRTSFGIHVLAIGGDKVSAELMGLKSGGIRCMIFVITGALSGLAGAFLAARTTTGNPLEAQGWETNAIAAVVLGGTLLNGGKGSIYSTMIGVALLTVIFQVLNFENGQGIPINSYWQNVIRGLFLLSIVVVQGVTTSRVNKSKA